MVRRIDVPPSAVNVEASNKKGATWFRRGHGSPRRVPSLLGARKTSDNNTKANDNVELALAA